MKRKLIRVLTVAIGIIILLPLAMDWFIIGNNIPSNVSNSEWVGFLGAYIGAIIGAIVSLVGIIITIRYTNEQNRIDRELQARPYCSIRYIHDDKIIGTEKILGELPIMCEPQENNGPIYTSIIYIKNIGLGPAIEFGFKVDKINDGRLHSPVLMQTDSDILNRSVNLLQPGEEAALPIYIYFNFDPIKEEDIVERTEGEILFFRVKHEVLNKYKNFNIVIHINYFDLFQNQYYQKIELASNMQVHIDGKLKQANHFCDIRLKEFTTPNRIKSTHMKAI